MKETLPKRKPNRLEFYDYGSPGAYFITICTKNRIRYFWDNVGATIGRPQDVILSKYGKIVDTAINNIFKTYPHVSVDCYAIMPNHIHLLLEIHEHENGRPMVAPTISVIIQQMKGYVTKQIGKSICQKLFHDHIIRGEDDYNKIAEYIYENPMHWKDDCFYDE